MRLDLNLSCCACVEIQPNCDVNMIANIKVDGAKTKHSTQNQHPKVLHNKRKLSTATSLGSYVDFRPSTLIHAIRFPHLFINNPHYFEILLP